MADGGEEDDIQVLQAKLQEAVSNIWRGVVDAVNKLLDADVKFGFHKIEANLNPSIEDIAHGLGVFEYVLNMMLDTEFLDHDERRTALNSKQCILVIRRLAEAIKSNNEEEYKQAIKLLDLQAKF